MPLVQKSISRFRCSITPCQHSHPSQESMESVGLASKLYPVISFQ